jgi:hypothetical protein
MNKNPFLKTITLLLLIIVTNQFYCFAQDDDKDLKEFINKFVESINASDITNMENDLIPFEDYMILVRKTNSELNIALFDEAKKDINFLSILESIDEHCYNLNRGKTKLSLRYVDKLNELAIPQIDSLICDDCPDRDILTDNFLNAYVIYRKYIETDKSTDSYRLLSKCNICQQQFLRMALDVRRFYNLSNQYKRITRSLKANAFDDDSCNIVMENMSIVKQANVDGIKVVRYLLRLRNTNSDSNDDIYELKVGVTNVNGRWRVMSF